VGGSDNFPKIARDGLSFQHDSNVGLGRLAEDLRADGLMSHDTGAPLQPSAQKPWSQLEKAVLALFALALLASLAVLTHPWNALVRDASTYLVVAKSLVAGEGYNYLEVPFTLRPPGTPLLLAPVVATAGVDFFALHLLTSFVGAVGVILLFVYLRDSLGWGVALLASTAVWLNPAFRDLSNQAMSDIPSLTLVVACLLVERRCHDGGGKQNALLGLLLGLGVLVRSANWLLVVAIVTSRVLQRWRAPEGNRETSAWAKTSLLTPVIVAVLVVSPWSLFTQMNPSPEVDDQIGIHAYATAMLHTDWGNPNSPTIAASEIFERVSLRSGQIATVLGSRLTVDRFGNRDADRPASAVEIGVTATLIACLLIALWRRGEPVELLCLAILPVTLVYFGFRSRLMLPVFVLALPCLLWVIRDIAAKRGFAQYGAGAALAVVVAILVVDFNPRAGWGAIEQAHAKWAQSCSALESVLEPDARVATRLGTHLAVCLKQPIYSVEFATRRNGAVQGIEQIVQTYDIDTVVLETRGPLAEAATTLYGPGQSAGPMSIWHLDRGA